VVRGKAPFESSGFALLPQHPVDFDAVQLHLVLRHEDLLQPLHSLCFQIDSIVLVTGSLPGPFRGQSLQADVIQRMDL
jgi:hypothetical protein